MNTTPMFLSGMVLALAWLTIDTIYNERFNVPNHTIEAAYETCGEFLVRNVARKWVTCSNDKLYKIEEG